MKTERVGYKPTVNRPFSKDLQLYWEKQARDYCAYKNLIQSGDQIMYTKQ